MPDEMDTTVGTAQRGRGERRIRSAVVWPRRLRVVAIGVLVFGWLVAPLAGAAQDEGETYTSPSYGYSLTYDPSVWENVREESVDSVDRLRLEHLDLATEVHLYGQDAFEGDAEACLEDFVEGIEASDDYTSVEPLTDENDEPVEGDLEIGDGVFAAYAGVIEDDEGAEETVIEYFACYTVEADVSTLGVQQLSDEADWEDANEAREELLETLTLEGEGTDEEETPEAEGTPEDEAATPEAAETPEDEEATTEPEATETSGDETGSVLGDEALVIIDRMTDERRGALRPEAPEGAEDIVSYRYEDGEYVIEALEEQAGAWWVGPVETFSDVIIEVDVRFAEEVEETYIGVGCRNDRRSAYSSYELVLEPVSRTLALVRWDADGAEVLDEARRLKVDPTDFARLTLSCISDEIVGSVNGVEMVRAEDDTLEDGGVYLTAGTFEGAEEVYEAHFDNLHIQGIEVED